MEKAPEIRRTAEVLQVELSPIDPLDPAQLEQVMLERSGLLKVRPPLPAAQSGDNFYHAIPFQVSCPQPSPHACGMRDTRHALMDCR